MSYILRAHVYARESQALRNYRDARRRFLERGVPGARDGYFTDAMTDRIRWQAYRDLIAGVEKAERLVEEAERAA